MDPYAWSWMRYIYVRTYAVMEFEQEYRFATGLRVLKVSQFIKRVVT